MSHFPYHHDTLDAPFCLEDGEPWPCLHYRQTHCRCTHAEPSHIEGHQCRWSCGCREFRAVTA